MAARSDQAFRDYRLVVEVRHISFNEPEFYAELAASRVGIVNVDQPCSATRCRRRRAPHRRPATSRARPQLQGLVPQDRRKDERYDYLYSARS